MADFFVTINKQTQAVVKVTNVADGDAAIAAANAGQGVQQSTLTLSVQYIPQVAPIAQ